MKIKPNNIILIYFEHFGGKIAQSLDMEKDSIRVIKKQIDLQIKK